jgi:ribosome-associated toxin RatA of RatAB toxin-antitoxin module
VRFVEIIATVTGGEPAAVFEALSDFERYPQATDAVRQVTVTPYTTSTVASSWEVNFRTGILRWKEQDEFDREARTIRFTQIEGDLEHFSGVWHVDEHDDGCVVRFVAQFDMGIPTLAAMLDPIAEGALRENVSNIIRCLIDHPLEIVAGPGQ